MLLFVCVQCFVQYMFGEAIAFSQDLTKWKINSAISAQSCVAFGNNAGCNPYALKLLGCTTSTCVCGTPAATSAVYTGALGGTAAIVCASGYGGGGPATCTAIGWSGASPCLGKASRVPSVLVDDF